MSNSNQNSPRVPLRVYVEAFVSMVSVDLANRRISYPPELTHNGSPNPKWISRAYWKRVNEMVGATGLQTKWRQRRAINFIHLHKCFRSTFQRDVVVAYLKRYYAEVLDEFELESEFTGRDLYMFLISKSLNFTYRGWIHFFDPLLNHATTRVAYPDLNAEEFFRVWEASSYLGQEILDFCRSPRTATEIQEQFGIPLLQLKLEQLDLMCEEKLLTRLDSHLPFGKQRFWNHLPPKTLAEILSDL